MIDAAPSGQPEGFISIAAEASAVVPYDKDKGPLAFIDAELDRAPTNEAQALILRDTNNWTDRIIADLTISLEENAAADFENASASSGTADTSPVERRCPHCGEVYIDKETQNDASSDTDYASSLEDPQHYPSTPPKNSRTSRYFIVPEDTRTGLAASMEEYTSRRARTPPPPSRDLEKELEELLAERQRLKLGGRKDAGFNYKPEKVDYSSKAEPRGVKPRDPPPLSRGESSRLPLYTEVSKYDGYTFKPEKVDYSSKKDPEKVKSSRRGASDPRDRFYYSDDTNRDNIDTPKSEKARYSRRPAPDAKDRFYYSDDTD